MLPLPPQDKYPLGRERTDYGLYGSQGELSQQQQVLHHKPPIAAISQDVCIRTTNRQGPTLTTTHMVRDPLSIITMHCTTGSSSIYWVLSLAHDQCRIYGNSPHLPPLLGLWSADGMLQFLLLLWQDPTHDPPMRLLRDLPYVRIPKNTPCFSPHGSSGIWRSVFPDIKLPLTNQCYQRHGFTGQGHSNWIAKSLRSRTGHCRRPSIPTDMGRNLG